MAAAYPAITCRGGDAGSAADGSATRGCLVRLPGKPDLQFIGDCLDAVTREAARLRPGRISLLATGARCRVVA